MTITPFFVCFIPLFRRARGWGRGLLYRLVLARLRVRRLRGRYRLLGRWVLPLLLLPVLMVMAAEERVEGPNSNNRGIGMCHARLY
jgi:hypothetical protein